MMLRLEQFSGIAPKISNRLLPPNVATVANNCRLLSGELRGIYSLTEVKRFDDTAASVVRIPNTPEDTWVRFTSSDVDFVKGPLVNDAYDRYYWTGDSNYAFVAYSTLSDLESDPPTNVYRLGVSAPPSAPSLAVSGGEGDIQETRAYVYTFVDEFGQEGPPSLPVVATGLSDDTWTLSNLATTMPDSTNRATLQYRRIYRTVVGQSSVLYYYITDLDLTDTSGDITTFDDDVDSDLVVQNNVCQSFNWDPPPDDLEGLTAHPGGFLVAFRGREVYFSEPYRPWAWPTQYIIAIEHDIVGIAIYNNLIMVMTNSNPYYMAGSHPANISQAQSQSIEPCLSKRSIVSTLQGVLYASPNGLVLFNEQGANSVTNPLLSREEWQRQFIPSGIKATQRGLEYLAFYNSSNGFEFSPAEPLGQLSKFNRFYEIDDIFTDRYSGAVYVTSNDVVYEWDSLDNIPIYYVWTSKVFDFPRPLNFGALILKMDEYEYLPVDTTLQDRELAWNVNRMQNPLNPLNYTSLGGSRFAMIPNIGTPNFNPTENDETAGADRRRYPLAGSPLFETYAYDTLTGASAVVEVFADGERVARMLVEPNKTMRLPSGFKAHTWQFKIESNVRVYSLAVAETAKELMNV